MYCILKQYREPAGTTGYSSFNAAKGTDGKIPQDRPALTACCPGVFVYEQFSLYLKWEIRKKRTHERSKERKKKPQKRTGRKK